MKYLLVLFCLAYTCIASPSENFYNLKALKINGDTLHFSELRGKKLMLVNVASKCGYTYQYSELQSLYNMYGGDRFEIIAFPANNFDNQEPGSDEDIYEFCTNTYGVTFTMMSKISVKGDDKHPVYQWLTLKNLNGKYNQEIMWNFQKYLISENGDLDSIYGSQTSPLNQNIINWLEEPASSVSNNSTSCDISIFPNPASDYIQINLTQPSEGSEIRIYNIYGECVIKLSPALSEGNEVRVNVSDLPAGVYYLRIGNTVQKFIII